MNVYYVGDVRSVIAGSTAIADHVRQRPINEADVPALADLYRSAYDSTMTLDQAVAEMHSAFYGSWGALWQNASPVAWIGDQLVAVVQTVRCPSWEDAPNCPWIIEVFTHPRHRRNGLARTLVGLACRVIQAGGDQRVGLTVDDANGPAVALYRSLGFKQAR